MNFARRVITLRLLMGVALGAVAGFSYYYFFGCSSGCAITSSPVNSILYGMLFGGFLLFKDKKPVESRADNSQVQ